MPTNRQGSFHLFRIAGIDVYLHWSWFILAVIEIGYLRSRYSTLLWSALEYLALFLIVLLHEFGHAFACRQVGGRANQIMLWPLGGVAYVEPPLRPGAMLWSIAAGPLVNVALLVPLGALGGRYFLADLLGRPRPESDGVTWLIAVLGIDIGLLIFNILPIYPLDGGQILRSLLWFVLGRGRSLQVATVIGFIGAAGFICFALLKQSVWLLAIAGYMLLNCWNGWKIARALIGMEKLPRREGYVCPSCGTKPPIGPHWHCPKCRRSFDTFETGAACPWCQAKFANTMCMDCQKTSSLRDWMAAGSYQGATRPESGAGAGQRQIGS
jgi:Zn-dependent protease